MSNYVWGTSLSWNDYLQARSFVDDISTSGREAGRSVSMEILRQTREVIASNEALARENIRVREGAHREHMATIEASTDRIVGELYAGFERLSYGLQDVSSGIADLNATFHWGFGELIAGIGHMNDALSVLIKIAKTPVQTVAFNHFEIARDAFRQNLLQEALEELQKAISGDHTSPGYKLEWRFHQMVGTIRLGFTDGDLSLIDLMQAEKAFLHAARYAKTDYPEDAGRAFLSAGWAAYCQGKMKEALAHTEQAIALLTKPGEAMFQAAKVRMALGEVDKALPVLGKAIDFDRFYALKAAGDGDFQKHDDRLREFLEAMRREKYRVTVPIMKEALAKLKYLGVAKSNINLQRIEAFLSEGANSMSLMDVLIERNALLATATGALQTEYEHRQRAEAMAEQALQTAISERDNAVATATKELEAPLPTWVHWGRESEANRMSVRNTISEVGSAAAIGLFLGIVAINAESILPKDGIVGWFVWAFGFYGWVTLPMIALVRFAGSGMRGAIRNAKVEARVRSLKAGAKKTFESAAEAAEKRLCEARPLLEERINQAATNRTKAEEALRWLNAQT